jgi:hypothetical protein
LTIRERHEIPDELPPARLYLDDVETIVDLFTQAADSESTTSVLSVGKFDCSTIEDLKQLGLPRAIRFRIEVKTESSSVAILRIDPSTTFWIFGPGLRPHDAFKVYGGLQAIFEVRKIQRKAALRSMPPWLLLAFILFCVISALAVTVAVNRVQPWHFGIGDVIFIVLRLPIPLWVFYKTAIEHSVVEFSRVHDLHGMRKRLAEWKPYIIAAIIGGFIKELFDLIAHALKR